MTERSVDKKTQVRSTEEALKLIDLLVKQDILTKHETNLLREALMSVPDGAQSRSDEEQPACDHEWLRGACLKCGQSIERLEPVVEPHKQQELASASVEPVGYWQGEFSEDGGATLYEVPQVSFFGRTYPNIPLYTSPPAQCKPLTDEEIAQSLEQYSDVIDPSHEFWKGITRAIEAAHGIKGQY